MKAEKEHLELKLKAVAFPQSVVEELKKSEKLGDYTLEVMKVEVASYLQVLVDEFREIDGS